MNAVALRVAPPRASTAPATPPAAGAPGPAQDAAAPEAPAGPLAALKRLAERFR
jgi:hypothetical protein